jgi:putative nucleotidyltransferase with HDIG domain
MGIYLNLKQLHNKVGELPFLPAVLTQLLQLNKNDETYYDQVIVLARKDPSISTLILKLANSATSGSIIKIDSLQKAMSRVGTHCIAGYIAALGVSRVFIPVNEEHKLLWNHSIETAIIAEFLAFKMPKLEVDRGVAYLSGLLHDIGRFVMLDTAPEALVDTPSSSWSSPQEHPTVEKEILGYDHSEAGLIACKHWELPTVICNVVRGHHMYSIFAKKELREDFRNLILIIQFADFISVIFSKNPEWLELSGKQLETNIKEVCIHKLWGDISLPTKELSIELPLLIKNARTMAQSIGCA